MKTWYIIVVLAVISAFAVCRYKTIKTYFLLKPFSRRSNNFRVLRFSRISADPAYGAYRKHSQASGLPKPSPLGIPRPFSVKKSRIVLVWIGFISFPYMGPYCCLVDSVNSSPLISAMPIRHTCTCPLLLQCRPGIAWRIHGVLWGASQRSAMLLTELIKQQ